jgi:hypothetical protein
MIHPLDGQPIQHPLVLRAGVTEIGFEMKVPSRLPESVNCRDFSVNYQVSAHMECDSNGLFKSPLYNGKVISAQDIPIVRLPTTRLITDNNVNLISDFRTYTSEWMDYQILVEKKTVSLGSVLPISFSLLPKKKGITIDHMSVQILEDRDIFTSYTHRTQSAHTIVPFLNNKTNIPNTPMAGTWEGTVVYKVPSNISLVHSTKKYDDYNITHTLAVHLLLSSPSSKKSKVRCKNMIIFKTKIDLLAEIPNEHSLIELPPYQLLHPTGTIKCLDTNHYSQNDYLPCYESLAY